MSHIGEVAAQYRIPIDRFIDAAERYCAFIEAWAAEPGQWEPLAFLKAVEPLLAEVAACSARLPADGELFSEEEDHEYELPDLETGVGLPSTPAEAHEAVLQKQRRDEERFPALRGMSLGGVELMEGIETFLGGANVYVALHDPYEGVNRRDPPSEAAVRYHSSLGDDLSSVYDWLKPPLMIWSHGTDAAMFESLWRWRFELDFHAGLHLVDALKPIYWIVHRAQSEDD